MRAPLRCVRRPQLARCITALHNARAAARHGGYYFSAAPLSSGPAEFRIDESEFTAVPSGANLQLAAAEAHTPSPQTSLLRRGRPSLSLGPLERDMCGVPPTTVGTASKVSSRISSRGRRTGRKPRKGEATPLSTGGAPGTSGGGMHPNTIDGEDRRRSLSRESSGKWAIANPASVTTPPASRRRANAKVAAVAATTPVSSSEAPAQAVAAEEPQLPLELLTVAEAGIAREISV
jgi:hypothetical protein